MNILGIETSGRRGSVALLRDGDVLAARRFPEGNRHERRIMESVDEVVREAGLARRDLDAVAVSEGPGSFTGLRIGVTCAKTLAHLLGLEAVGVPTLEVLTQNACPAEHGCRVVCPLLDARRKAVYGAVFEWEDGRWADRTGVLILPPAELAAKIPAGALVFGSGYDAYPDAFVPGPDPDAPRRAGPPELALGRAEQVARVGLRMLAQDGGVDPMTLVARYYRRTEAEENLAKR